jgi:hypothetical protein
MDEWMDGWVDRWMGMVGWVGGWMSGWMDEGWVYRRMGECMEGWVSGWVDGRIGSSMVWWLSGQIHRWVKRVSKMRIAQLCKCTLGSDYKLLNPCSVFTRCVTLNKLLNHSALASSSENGHFYLFLYFGGTQGLTLARQVLCHSSHSASLFLYWVFSR